MNMRIYHVFTSANHVHTLNIIRFFHDKCLEVGTQWQDHRFVLLAPPEQESSPLSGELYLEPGQLQPASEESGDAYRMLRSISAHDCMILHAAFFSWRFWLRLLCRPGLWKRTAWIMWGGDIHTLKAYSQCRSLKSMVYLALAKVVVPRLGAVSALAPGDYDIVRELFGQQCNNYIRAFYSLDILLRATADRKRVASSDGRLLRILLGNSGDPSNHHVEALGWLARYRDEDIEIVCPLGYGGSVQYRKEVIETGQHSLGRKFRPITDMLSQTEYFALLDKVGILVLNHRRQQGLANVYYLLAGGKKVYVRRDATTYSMLRDFGIVIGDSCSLCEESFTRFAAPLPADIKEANVKRCQERFSSDAAVDGWKQLFEMFRNWCSRKC